MRQYVRVALKGNKTGIHRNGALLCLFFAPGGFLRCEILKHCGKDIRTFYVVCHGVGSGRNPR